MKYGLVALAGALAAVAAAQAADGPVYVYSVMKDIVVPQAADLWDVGNRAMDDNGNPDVSQLSEADWVKLGKAAEAMRGGSLAMANAPKLAVAPAGVKMQDEGGEGGGATAAQIQGFIDADPKGFAAHAKELADVSDTFLAAVKTRDAKTLADASGRLDAVCEACHSKYWYPQPQ
jgi:cytochrome c556